MFFYFTGNTVMAVNAKLALSESLGKETEYAGVGPFTVTGDQWITYDAMPLPDSRPNTIISKDCTNPERAIKFFEYLMTEEANLAVWYGIYNEDWIDKQDGDVIYPEPIGEKLEAISDMNTMNEMGIYNYRKTFLAAISIYDQLNSYYKRFDPVEEVYYKGMVPWAKTRKTNVLSALPFKVPINPGTYLAEKRGDLADIYSSLIPQIVLAKNDQEFDALYTELIDSINRAGKDDFFSMLRPEFDKVLNTFEAAGVVFE